MTKTSTYLDKAVFDDQGKYLWSLVRKAGWDSKQLQQLLMKKYDKTHWNILNETERRQVIGILRSYADKNKEPYEKRLRQKIVATAIKNGITTEELHDLMYQWGLGKSLKACNSHQLMTILSNVHNIARKNKNGGEE